MAFDKVKNLNGYPIRTGALHLSPTLMINNQSKGWLNRHVGVDAMTTYTIWKSLNASIQTFYYRGRNIIGFEADDKSYTGLMADITMGRIDHGMNAMWTDNHWRSCSSYPHVQSELHWVTPSRGNMPKWLKFASMQKNPMATGYQATLSIAVIFLRYVERRPWSTAIFEVLRMAVATSMLSLQRSLSSRIFWSMALIMSLIATSTFQGSLISLLTEPSPYRNIDGIDDLLASGYPIFAYGPFAAFFEGSKLSKQLDRYSIATYESQCFELVYHGRRVACIMEYWLLQSTVGSQKEFHLSKESLTSYYSTYFTKTDWPLFKVFDTILRRMFNAGIIGYWKVYYQTEVILKNWSVMRNNMPPGWKILSVDDIVFLFYILISGLICSSLVFVIEVILGRVGHRD